MISKFFETPEPFPKLERNGVSTTEKRESAVEFMPDNRELSEEEILTHYVNFRDRTGYTIPSLEAELEVQPATRTSNENKGYGLDKGSGEKLGLMVLAFATSEARSSEGHISRNAAGVVRIVVDHETFRGFVNPRRQN